MLSRARKPRGRFGCDTILRLQINDGGGTWYLTWWFRSTSINWQTRSKTRLRESHFSLLRMQGEWTHFRPGGSQRRFQIAGGRDRAGGNYGRDGCGQQNAATDTGVVGKDIPEFHRAARREVLASLHEEANQEH